jgi:hypothetical protein
MAGETTSAASLDPPFAGFDGLFLVPFTMSYATTQLEINDVMEAGYLPANVTVYGFLVSASDMDTNGAPALSQKLTLGSTDLVTGITAGQAGTSAVYACAPTTITAKTLLKVTNTAAAATAAAGTLNVAAICQK